MTSIDEYADSLPSDLLGVWPHVAECARQVGGVLMGGTAVAIHLRHRTSEDLDVMTLREFSGTTVKNALGKTGATVEVIEVARNMFHGFVDTVKVDVFRALESNGVQPSSMTQVAPAWTVSGMEVGALPDLLATKLDVILHRPKLRDYIDLAAIDQSDGHSLESGLAYYCRRYGYDHAPRVLERIIRLLDDPGRLPLDPEFSEIGAESLSYLKGRVPALEQRLSDMRDISV
ncbi:MAG: nucleotidyl transferase AbiEii/AbiGii toxin family protein [Acidimicrobiia bacterium]|nr:nucleotidyl transferase AbiEii/AbiGii toxin family protein [Acidimicrobiia bacterium]MCY4433324.1 nucleotidyl transferase AbiEii/AbiGii toxin family protein [bacterium]